MVSCQAATPVLEVVCVAAGLDGGQVAAPWGKLSSSGPQGRRYGSGPGANGQAAAPGTGAACLLLPRVSSLMFMQGGP